MNIFVAGVHGVGKTFLASRLPASLGLTHRSASMLIKEARNGPNWTMNKRVGQVDQNQFALVAAVRRHNDAGTRLLLDGHFVLLDSGGGFVRLDCEVFRSLNLTGVILLEDEPAVIVERIRQRDGRDGTERIDAFMSEERSQAKAVCDELGIPLRALIAPSIDAFVNAISVAESSARSKAAAE